jgi:hypothetical protein
LKDERTTLELTAALSKVLEDILIPDIYVVPHSKLPYLPSGKLDRLKLVKMYKYRRMECEQPANPFSLRTTKALKSYQ